MPACLHPCIPASLHPCIHAAVSPSLPPSLYSSPHSARQPKALFLEVQQEVLERCAEIILAEGAFFGANAPFRPSLPPSPPLLSGSESEGEMSDGRVGGTRVSGTVGG